MQYVPLKLGDYVYPVWSNVVGWMLILSVIAPIPIIAIKTMLNGRGSLAEVSNRYLSKVVFTTTDFSMQRWRYATTSKLGVPKRDKNVDALLV